MPPVGQKSASLKGPPKALSASTPPTMVAGKSLKASSPYSKPLIISLAVATPGSNGMFLSFMDAAKERVKPGEIANFAPASSTALKVSAFMTVPAPVMASGKALATASIASSAFGVLRVI